MIETTTREDPRPEAGASRSGFRMHSETATEHCSLRRLRGDFYGLPGPSSVDTIVLPEKASCPAKRHDKVKGETLFGRFSQILSDQHFVSVLNFLQLPKFHIFER